LTIANFELSRLSRSPGQVTYFSVGEVFAGRYELIDVLDDGGMGTVWRVWDLRDRTYRAAKMLRQSDSTSLLRFVRETGTRIEHPHVIAPTGWSAEDDRVLFAMPLVGGGSVATLVADYGALPASLVRTLMLQLLEALAAVHAAGMVHRDVKPANLLLEPSGTGEPHLRLSDFGIAAPLDEPRLTRSSDTMHTPGYSAPEVAAGADPDPVQDLYSVGIVMQEMLTGVRPEVSGPPDPVSGELASVRARLVAPDPLARFASAAEARAALLAAEMSLDPDADPIEVFSHLPELPPGWGPGGPGTPATTPEQARLPGKPTSASTRSYVAAGLLAVAGVAAIVVAVLAL
jgi:serine/threonine protein kinase